MDGMNTINADTGDEKAKVTGSTITNFIIKRQSK